MALHELIVEGLFGEFTHKVDFHTDEGLTLVHGPNGVGKTTVLKIVDSFFNHRFMALRRIPFGVVNLQLTTGEKLQITRKDGDPAGKGDKTWLLEFIYTSQLGKSQAWTYRHVVAADFPMHMIDEYLPELNRVGPSEWFDLSNGDTLDFEQVADRYSDRLPVRTGRPQKDPEWLAEFIAQVPVYFIEAQRLQSVASPRSQRFRRAHGDRAQVPTVMIHAEDLAETIKRTLAAYADFSQSRDSTFPTRLLDRGSNPKAPLEQDVILERYAAQAEQRQRYVRAGLLDAGSELTLPDRQLDETERRVLEMLLDDVDQKLAQLSNLSQKLDLFLSIINGKFRRKSMTVDRERGFRVTTLDGDPLEVTSLSSGEQQEVVLAYGLLFREKPGTLVLLDEPELSLHVSWQLDLIPDLLKIAEVAELEFLVATHSPQVIGERWDLTVELSDGA